MVGREENVEVIALSLGDLNTICFQFFRYFHDVNLNLLAYTLYNCGASNSFISSAFLDRYR
jgi:hypothetical protein